MRTFAWCGISQSTSSSAIGAALDAELRLQQARGAGKDVVRRRSREHNQVEVARARVGRLQRAAARFQREVARSLAFIGNVPLHDAGARADPLVARVQARGE